MKRIKALAAATALTLALTGCMAQEVSLNFNQDSSGTAKVGFYLADSYLEEMGTTPEEFQASEPDATPASRVFNGENYTGVVNDLSFKNPKKIADLLNSEMSEEEGYNLDDTGGFKAEVSTQDGKDVLTFSIIAPKETTTTAPIIPAKGVTVEGDVTVDMSGMEEMLDAIILEMDLTFPGGVMSVDADQSLYKIDDNTVRLSITGADLSKDIHVVGILGEAGTVPVDNRSTRFPEVNKYDGRFMDVATEAWYAEAVNRAFNIGIVAGTSGTTFSPDATLTKSQVIVMAARMHSIYAQDGETFEGGQNWYQAFVDYAIAKGIIGGNQFSDYNTPASRAEMAYVFAHALPDEMYDAGQNADFSDVPTSHPYYDSIMKLYNSGIVAGVGGNKYAPDSTVTRGQAAVFVARLSTPESRS